MEMSAEAAVPPEPSRARRRIALALIVVATVLALLATFALWANRQLLNTDNWVDTSRRRPRYWPRRRRRDVEAPASQ
jgi:hypothetical protein